jgi:aspartate aminotransferase
MDSTEITVLELAGRTNIVSPPKTSAMRNLANSLKEAGENVINFAAGELDVDTSDIVKEAATKAINQQCNQYTPAMGSIDLRACIAKYINYKYQTNYQVKQIGVTAGAKQALFNACMTLINSGDEVIIPSPYWVTYPTQVEIASGIPVFVDTKETGYKLTANVVDAAITPATKAIIINSPNNPTGTVYEREELRKIAQLAVKHQLWIIFDECYSELLRKDVEHVNLFSLVPGLEDRVVLINSFSKSHALTGWRIGYVAGPLHLIKAMENLQGHTTSNPNSIAQRAVMASLLSNDKVFINNVNDLLEERLAIAKTIVDDIDGVTYAPTEGAFYLFLNVSNVLGKYCKGEKILTTDRFCELALQETKVALVSGSAFGDSSSVRISYAINTEDMQEGLLRLKEFMNKKLTSEILGQCVQLLNKTKTLLRSAFN